MVQLILSDPGKAGKGSVDPIDPRKEAHLVGCYALHLFICTQLIGKFPPHFSLTTHT